MLRDFSSEVFFKTARSGGKGGQNVNKVETMAEAWWPVKDSAYYNEEEKERILDKLKSRINKDFLLFTKSSETRSQLENKQIALKKMLELVAKTIAVPKKRKPTKISRTTKEKRLASKKKESEKKKLRKRDWL